jgi:hypothetical protein
VAAEADLLKFNFVEEMRAVEARIVEGGPRPLNDLHRYFGDLDDGLFAMLVARSFNGFDAVRALLPDWASDAVRHGSTGDFTEHQHNLDASWFWRTVRDHFEKLTGREIGSATVADYGAGWGRIARYANKDVPAERFHALEPNPDFQRIYAESRLPGHLVPTDWLSAEPTGVAGVDLIFSYSILTHSSRRLTENIVNRWIEMTTPGSVVAFTIRPGFYLDESGGDVELFSSPERDDARDKYARGEFVYKPYPGEEDWGVTILPLRYLEQLMEGRFKIVKTAFQLQTTNQLIVFAQRI